MSIENKAIRALQRTARDLEQQSQRVEARADKKILSVAKRKAPAKKGEFVKLTDRGRSTYWRVDQLYGRYTPMDTDVRWILWLCRTASNGDARFGRRIISELEFQNGGMVIVASAKPFKAEA